MSHRLWTVLLLSLFMASCGTSKLSTKELAEVDSGKKSIFTTYNQPLMASLIFAEQPITQIISIDGRKVASEILNTEEQITLEVGIHKIELTCVNRSGYDERDYSEIIELIIKPHHKYRVRCSFDTDFGADGIYKGSFSVTESRAE